MDDLGEKYNANDLCALSKHLLAGPIDLAYNASVRRLFVVCSDGNMAVLNHNTALGISAWGRYITDGCFLSVCVCNDKTYVITLRNDIYYLEVFDSKYMYDNNQLSYTCCAASLPLRTSNHNAGRIRLHKVAARVLDTKTISLNQHNIALPNKVYASQSSGYSGDVSVSLLGTTTDTVSSLWTLEANAAYPLTVLSVTVHGWYSV